MDAVEDKRLERPNLCRVTTMVGQTEFICIREEHAKIYQRKTQRTRDAFGGFLSSNPQADQHYFVRRYPMGEH